MIRHGPGLVRRASWRIAAANHDAIQLEADSPLFGAVIVGRRTQPGRVMLATFVSYGAGRPD
jgi:hypothetical protein